MGEADVWRCAKCDVVITPSDRAVSAYRIVEGPTSTVIFHEAHWESSLDYREIGRGYPVPGDRVQLQSDQQ